MLDDPGVHMFRSFLYVMPKSLVRLTLHGSTRAFFITPKKSIPSLHPSFSIVDSLKMVYQVFAGQKIIIFFEALRDGLFCLTSLMINVMTYDYKLNQFWGGKLTQNELPHCSALKKSKSPKQGIHAHLSHLCC